MGIRILLERPAASSPVIYEGQLSQSEGRRGQPVFLSSHIILHRAVVAEDSVSKFDDLAQCLGLMTDEERELFRLLSEMEYFFDFERVCWFRDILLQRHITRCASHLQERFVFTRGRSVVESILREVFPTIDRVLLETAELPTEAWLSWYYQGDLASWRLFEPHLGNLKPTTVDTMLTQVSSWPGPTIKRFVLGPGITMTKWARVWNLLFFHHLVIPTVGSSFWGTFCRYFQVQVSGRPQPPRPRSMAAIVSRHIGGQHRSIRAQAEHKLEEERIRTIIASHTARAVSLEPVEPQHYVGIPLVEELYYLIARLERNGDFPAEFFRQLPSYIFQTVEDYIPYLRWKGLIAAGKRPFSRPFVRVGDEALAWSRDPANSGDVSDNSGTS